MIIKENLIFRYDNVIDKHYCDNIFNYYKNNHNNNLNDTTKLPWFEGNILYWDFLKNKPIKKLKSKSCGSVWKMKETTSSREISTYKKIRDGYKIQNLISFCEHNHFKNYNHPTIKPIKLLTYLINLCSQENELVFDGFSGSGSCAVACIKTNRRFIGCELDNQYFDLACKRIETELKQGDLF